MILSACGRPRARRRAAEPPARYEARQARTATEDDVRAELGRDRARVAGARGALPYPVLTPAVIAAREARAAERLVEFERRKVVRAYRDEFEAYGPQPPPAPTGE